MNDTAITGRDYLHALDLHLEAFEVWYWLGDVTRQDYYMPGGLRFPDAEVTAKRGYCKRIARQRGWRWQQVLDYVASPEKPQPLDGERKKRYGEIGVSDPEQTVRNILHRLRGTQPRPQEPSPERKKELTAELIRNIMPLSGTAHLELDAYDRAERASIRAEEPTAGVRTVAIAMEEDRDPFAD